MDGGRQGIPGEQGHSGGKVTGHGTVGDRSVGVDSHYQGKFKIRSMC